MLTFEDIARARKRLEGVAIRTPVLRSRQFDEAAGAEVFFKAENFQRAGAFKFRGAYNKIKTETERQKVSEVVAYSSGNHAQAVALVSKLLKLKATIVMPQDAPASKLAATRGYGAEVVLYDRYGRRGAARGGARFGRPPRPGLRRRTDGRLGHGRKAPAASDRNLRNRTRDGG